ncbi:MAG TPA: hypothetical protein VFW96_12395 [Thermomicrobiales bacterium]|nr:hypothetical protein [Thermomicrobiales bacterium]
MMTLYDAETIARHRREMLQHDAALQRAIAAQRAPVRERVARALFALALRVEPAQAHTA